MTAVEPGAAASAPASHLTPAQAGLQARARAFVDEVLAAAAGDVLLARCPDLLELNPVIVHPHGATVADAPAHARPPGGDP
jgi:hypothetical protein